MQQGIEDYVDKYLVTIATDWQTNQFQILLALGVTQSIHSGLKEQLWIDSVQSYLD